VPLSTGLAATAAAVVGTASVVIAVAAWRSLLASGNRNIGFVVAAFAVLAAKSFVKSTTLASGEEGAGVELALTLCDLVVVGLFAWPILFPRRTPR
jgi:hypothetical protein